MDRDATLPPTGGPYSLARRLPNGLVLVAGQTGLDPATGQLAPGGIREQTSRAIANIALILASEGLTLRDVVKTSVFIARPEDFAAMNEAYGAAFQPPLPVRTTVAAGIGPGILVEIEAMAFDPAHGR